MTDISLDVDLGKSDKNIPYAMLHFTEGTKEFRHFLTKENGEIKCWKRDGSEEGPIMEGEGESIGEDNILMRYGTEIGWVINNYFGVSS